MVFLCDYKNISFVYMKLPDAEKAYKRMMNRKGKVSLCKLDPKEAIQVIERLNAFFQSLSAFIFLLS